MTVVVSSCSTIAGPEILCPGSIRSRVINFAVELAVLLAEEHFAPADARLFDFSTRRFRRREPRLGHDAKRDQAYADELDGLRFGLVAVRLLVLRVEAPPHVI
jgi:hypothetical protein